jgi:hypothetical protein
MNNTTAVQTDFCPVISPEKRVEQLVQLVADLFASGHYSRETGLITTEYTKRHPGGTPFKEYEIRAVNAAEEALQQIERLVEIRSEVDAEMKAEQEEERLIV